MNKIFAALICILALITYPALAGTIEAAPPSNPSMGIVQPNEDKIETSIESEPNISPEGTFNNTDGAMDITTPFDPPNLFVPNPSLGTTYPDMESQNQKNTGVVEDVGADANINNE